MREFTIPIKRLTLSFGFTAVLMFSIAPLFGQIFNMYNGIETTCSGSFQDDGIAGGPYSNTDYTFTICPATPGDVIQVEFVAFSLFTSPNPNNSDRLFIYDGDDVTANTLGSYTGNALQGLPVTGTVVNTTGCLTFVFDVSPSSTGTFPGWEAIITCTTPCAPPTAEAAILDPPPLGAEQTIGVCLGQDITFTDMGSFAEPGFNIEYWIWNWDDGTFDTLTSAADVTHAFSEPGEYIVNLSVEDNNGCRNLNLQPLQILVSTIPIFNTDFDSPVCLNEPIEIDANPIQSVTWTALPPQVVAGETFLADGAGFSYSSSLVFDFFEPGATLENCDDFLDVFVNIEHSYLGDLGFSLTCPNGTVVNMLSFPNGGGGTFLGEALDDPTMDPGIGFDYGWAPGQTNGNLDEQTNIPVGGPTPGNAVPPGTYQSEEDLCNFVGCPLNGEWTFSVSDNLGADNGYIFEWGINFDPSLFPDITTFTPIIGLEIDSSFWEGPNIINTSSDGNIIETLYTTPGTYQYTYFATNNFGCTFDTTITVEAIEGPSITAGPDLFVCDEAVTLQAALTGPNTPNCSADAGTYNVCYGNNETLTGTYCPDNPGDGITFMEITFLSGTLNTFADQLLIYDGDNTGAPLLANVFNFDLTGLNFVATNPSGCITWQLISDDFGSCEDGQYQEWEINVSCPGDSPLVWSWDPPTGLSNPNVQNPSVLVEQATLYTLTAYPVGLPGCVISDQVLVSPDPNADPGLDTDTTFCYNSALSSLTNYLGGNPTPGGTWVNLGTGETVNNIFNPTDYVDGLTATFEYTISNGLCEGNSILEITVLPSTDNTCCQTNALTGPDAIACGPTYQLIGSTPLGTGTWTGPENVTFSDANDPNAIVTFLSSGYEDITLTWTDSNGAFCEASDDVVVSFSEPLEIQLVPSDAICFDQCTGTAIVIPSGGTAPNSIYNFLWSSGAPGVIPQARDSLCMGSHMVTVVDDLGCADSLEFEIGQPAAQEMFVTFLSPSCADSCDARVTITSAGATSYSFDGQESWQADNIGFKCAGADTVYARNDAGCIAAESIQIFEPARFEANFNVNPNVTTVRNTLITFQDVSEPGPLASSLFTFGNDPLLGEIDERFTTFRFPNDTSGIYQITLISTNENGCSDTLVRELEIKDDLLWFIPNSFSPNEDGINDIWRPVGNEVDVTNYRLTIYDRLGREVFHTTNFDQGWNGAVEGSDYYVDPGVFTYFIKVTSRTTTEKFEFTGTITAVR
jgi:gliding motility-associated-like protein